MTRYAKEAMHDALMFTLLGAFIVWVLSTLGIGSIPPLPDDSDLTTHTAMRGRVFTLDRPTSGTISWRDAVTTK